MAQQKTIATIQILIDETDEAHASDTISELLSQENNGVIDWQYLPLGGQRLTPQAIIIDDEYIQGSVF